MEKQSIIDVPFKKLNDSAIAPEYATADAACMDVFYAKGIARTDWEFIGHEGFAYTVKTGLAFEVPKGHVMKVFSRSGHGFKYFCRLANSTGIIDADYRGELMIKLISKRIFEVDPGAGIAQLMILPYPKIVLHEVQELTDTVRGSDGFGSTDKKEKNGK